MNKLKAYDVILSPVITEKATQVSEANQVIFKVARTATKPQIKAAVEKLSRQDGTSINQFVVIAVAEKIAAMTTEEFFAERKARADREAFRRLLDRKGGEPPRPEDELPRCALGQSVG